MCKNAQNAHNTLKYIKYSENKFPFRLHFFNFLRKNVNLHNRYIYQNTQNIDFHNI